MIVGWWVPVVIATTLLIVACAGRKPQPREQADEAVSPLEPFTKITLENGLEVIVKEVHTAPIVAVYLWCNTGSVNETEHEQGISHFYEHMFFKGTEKRGVGEIDLAIKSLGGYNNAFTSKEYTAYYVVLPSKNFTLAADVLVDAIRNSAFPPEEIEKEMGVIKEEINRKDDDPTGALYEEMFKLMFPGTPYAHPVLGSKESVSGITREDFRAYLAKYYVPNNMTAVVVGDIKTDDAIAEIRRLTDGWRSDPQVAERIQDIRVPRREGIKGFQMAKDVGMAYVMLAFQTDGLSDIGQSMALDVASSVLGEGQSSRLYRRLVEKDRLVSSVNCFIYPLQHTGMFVIFATMDPANVDAFRAAVLEEVQILRDNPLPPDELAKVKTMLTADFAFANETDADIGQSFGYYETIGMLDTYIGYRDLIRGVAAGDVARNAGAVLDPDACTVGVVVPRGGTGEAR